MDNSHPPTPRDKPQDLRAVLPELLALIRKHYHLPHGYLLAILRGIIRGLEITASLPLLKRSYFRSLTAVGFLVLLKLGIFAYLVGFGHSLPAVVATAAWFAIGAVVVLSQLTLVRPPKGMPLDNFGLANSFTLYRFLNIAFLVSLLPHAATNRNVLYLTTVVFALTAISDAADGMYARRKGQVTEFGRIYDPVCDIAINAGVCLSAWVAGFLPGWYVFLAEIRFFLPLLGGALIYVHRRPYPVRPTFWGKASVVAYSFVLGLMLLQRLTNAEFIQDFAEKLEWISGALFVLYIIMLIDRGIAMLRVPRRES